MKRKINQSFMRPTARITTNRQTAWTPPPAFLFLHIQLSKSIRNGIDPSLVFETRRDNNFPARVAPVMELMLLESDARVGRRSAVRPGQEPNK